MALHDIGVVGMAVMGRSHPSRVRGLKNGICKEKCVEQNVAPFTGAWIENRLSARGRKALYMVAPFTGAWIEKRKPKRRKAS